VLDDLAVGNIDVLDHEEGSSPITGGMICPLEEDDTSIAPALTGV